MQIKSFRFNLQELGGALGDLGTLLPLMVALILINGLNATPVLVGVGLFYIVSGLYYRIPMPVQPLKALAAIAISQGLSSGTIGAASLLMGVILLFFSLTNLIAAVVRLFPQAVVRGIQLSIGLTLLRKGIEIAFGKQVFISGYPDFTGPEQFPVGIVLAVSAILIFLLFNFFIFRQNHRFPASLALLIFGVATGLAFGPTPQIDRLSLTPPALSQPCISDLWLALTVLVIPQLPLTLGNAVVSTCDVAGTYLGNRARRVTPRSLTASMGLANLVAGLFGAMPMCHGSGGLTAHYKLGARTGGANLMIGSLFLILGIMFGPAALPYFSLIPLPVLGVLLAVVGIYHACLIRNLSTRKQLAVAGTVAVVTVVLDNLAFGFAAGILLHHLLKLSQKGCVPPLQPK